MTDAAKFMEHHNFATLIELLNALRQEGKVDEIARALPYAPERLELVDILNTLARLGFRGAPIRLRAREISPRLLPCLFVDKQGRLSAITQPTTDPMRGTAYVFLGQKSPKDPPQSWDVGWFRQQVYRFRPTLRLAAGLALAKGVAAVSIPFFIMAIFDRAAGVASAQTIYALGAGALIALLIQGVLGAMVSRTLAWLSARLHYIVGVSVFAHILRLPAAAVERVSVASQVAQINRFESLSGFFAAPAFANLFELPASLLPLLALVFIGGALGFAPLAAIALCCLLALCLHVWLRRAVSRAWQSRAGVEGRHIELFEKLPMLRVSGMAEIWAEQFREASAQSALAEIRARYLGRALDSLAGAMALLAGLATVYFGVGRVWDGSMTGGALFASFLLTVMAVAPWSTLCRSLPRLHQLRGAIEQLDRLMALEAGRQPASETPEADHIEIAEPAPESALAFANVSMRYGADREPVFTDLSFAIRPGELVAVTGADGGGKSTILKLALGLYRPQQGVITLNGHDIDPAAICRSVAYVPQAVELFDGTVAENVRLGNPSASDDDVRSALDIGPTPDGVFGLDTQVRTGGEELPSNLACRIALARAYVRHAGVMLIDELPLAFLDSPAGKRFTERIRAWRGRKTIVFVTSRNDLIRMSDRAIALLGGGRAAVGAPDEIIQTLLEVSLSESRRVA